MKKLLLSLFLLASLTTFAQIKVIGDTTDLKTYQGSTLVLLLHYGAGSEEGAGLFRRIDSTYAEDGVNAFAYPVNGYQWARVNLLSGGANFNLISLKEDVSIGTAAFTTTDAEDTVVIAGALPTDIYVVSPQYTAGVDQQDVLEWEAGTDTLFVHRLASGESGLGYSWLRIRKY